MLAKLGRSDLQYLQYETSLTLLTLRGLIDPTSTLDGLTRA